MKKTLIILLLACYQFSFLGNVWAEIRNYTLNQIEITDETGTPKFKTLQSDGKQITENLVIAGLGTSKVTAQCPIYSLAIETEIYPMSPYTHAHLYSPDNVTDKSKWFYVRHDQGVTLIELKGDDVKVHNIGLVPYTYVGKREKGQ